MTRLRKKSMKHQPELCVRIKELRKQSGESLQSLAEKTHIPIHHLKALEKCEYHKLPEGVYRRAIMKKVLRALRIDPELFADDMPKQATSSAQSTTKPTWKERTAPIINMALTARIALVVLIMTIIGGYLGMHVYGLLRSPKLVIATPREGQVVSVPEITIRGNTDVGAAIHINGIEVLPTNTGNFEQIIPLRVGANAVTIVAEKKFGATSNVARSVIFEPIEEGDDTAQVSLAP